MFKKMLLATPAIVGLALAFGQPAKAQTLDQFCQAMHGGNTPSQQFACATTNPEMRAVLADNVRLVGQIASHLDPAGLAQWKATNEQRQGETARACGLTSPPQLTPAAEACYLARARQLNETYRQWLATNGGSSIRQPQFANLGNPVAGATQAAPAAQTQANADCLRYRYGILAGLHANEQCTYPPEAFMPKPRPVCVGPVAAALYGGQCEYHDNPAFQPIPMNPIPMDQGPTSQNCTFWRNGRGMTCQ
jgi:hypothetical protein